MSRNESESESDFRPLVGVQIF